MDLSLFYLPTWREGFGIPLQTYYEEIIETVKLADSLGWSRVLTTEHHFHYYGGPVPNPAIILAAWARETKTIRLAPAVSLMQLRDPIKVAEDYALVDQLSGGRVDMGVGKGFAPHEFAAFNITQVQVADRIREGLEICEQFWTGKPFSHQGQYFAFERLQPWPTTINGKLPIWNAASNSKESFINAARCGYHLMMNHYPMDIGSLVEKFHWYCDAWERFGRATSKRKAMVAFMCHIADTEEQALQEAKGPLQEHASAFTKVMAGNQWDTNYEGNLSVLKKMSANGDWRDIFRSRTLICTAEQAIERISKYIDLGFTEVSIVPRYAGISHQQCMETILRINNEVLPHIKIRGK